MTLEGIIKTYGTADYYDMNSGKIYHISEFTYDAETNKSKVPVSEDGQIIGFATVDGNVEDIAY